MEALILILGSVVAAAIIAAAIKVALRIPALPPQAELVAFGAILLVCLLTVFGFCGQ